MAHQQEEEQQQQQEEELRVSVCSAGVDVDINSNGDDGGGGNSKAPRLPRWTRQEILVLIQGKRVAENRVRRGRSAAFAGGGQAVEPKWATVSSYCKRHGVNRGPVQCRKRWSNLAGDFKKIKEWESQIKDDSDSFWLMRNDLRRDKKLPGFFDKEVYDILDGAGPPTQPDPDPEPDEAKAVPEAVFDSGRAAAADVGLFSDFELSGDQDHDHDGLTPEAEAQKQADRDPIPTAVTPLSEKQYQPIPAQPIDPGTCNSNINININEKQQEAEPINNPDQLIGSTAQGERKRRRLMAEDEAENQIIQVMERNSRILRDQLEAQKMNMKVDREERKEHTSSLVAVLHKLADSLARIADKL